MEATYIIKVIAFLVITYMGSGLIGKQILLIAQPSGMDFNVPTKRAIAYGYVTFIISVCVLLFVCLTTNQKEN